MTLLLFDGAFVKKKQMQLVAAFSIVVVLGLGHPAVTQFKQITLSAPAPSEARCSMEGGYLAEKDTRIKALERHGWRVIMWDCKPGADS